MKEKWILGTTVPVFDVFTTIKNFSSRFEGIPPTYMAWL
jgi:hypothetical protein